MIEREIAVVVSNANREVNVFDTMDAIQNAGFKNVFIQWYNREWNPTQEEQLRYIKEKGLNVIFAHLGYQNINSLWLDNEEGGNKLVERYKFAVHLHDNDKSEDLHLMPFDGTIDWKQIIKDLKNCNYSGPITMELCYRYDYLAMSIDNFYKKGYEIGEKLKEMFEEVSYH